MDHYIFPVSYCDSCSKRSEIVCSSARGAMSYCQSHGKRLPTEAQWEYAARGGGASAYPWGDEPPRCEGVAIGRRPGQPCAAAGPELPDVGTMAMDRSPQGVRDLVGSVQEWMLDRYINPYPDCGACRDPVVDTQTDTPMRSVRGGDYHAALVDSHTAPRNSWNQEDGGTNLGFRCASSVPR